MVQILNPQLDVLVEVPGDSVRAYCQNNGLVAKRGITGDLVAYPATTESLLQRLEAAGIVIRHINPERSIRDEVKRHLAGGRSVAIALTPKDMRHFFSPKGFFQAMDKLLKEVTEAEVIIPAGVYGDRCIFAVQPRVSEVEENDGRSNAPPTHC